MVQVRNASQDVCCRRFVQAMFPIVFNSARSRHSIGCYPQYERYLGWCTHQGVPLQYHFFLHHYCIGTERYHMLGGRCLFLDTSRLRRCSGCLIEFSFVVLKNNRQNVCTHFSSTKCGCRSLESIFVCCSQNSQNQNFCCKEWPQNATQLQKCWRETSSSCCSVFACFTFKLCQGFAGNLPHAEPPLQEAAGTRVPPTWYSPKRTLTFNPLGCIPPHLPCHLYTGNPASGGVEITPAHDVLKRSFWS